MCGVESSLDIDNVEIDPAEVRRWNSACVWVLSWIFDCDHAPFELSTVAGAWGMDMGDPVWSSYIALECSIFFAAMHRTSLRKCPSYLHERMMLELMHHHRFEVFCFDWWWTIGTNERLQRIKSLCRKATANNLCFAIIMIIIIPGESCLPQVKWFSKNVSIYCAHIMFWVRCSDAFSTNNINKRQKAPKLNFF